MVHRIFHPIVGKIIKPEIIGIYFLLKLILSIRKRNPLVISKMNKLINKSCSNKILSLIC
jgi:hypothetical protein